MRKFLHNKFAEYYWINSVNNSVNDIVKNIAVYLKASKKKKINVLDLGIGSGLITKRIQENVEWKKKINFFGCDCVVDNSAKKICKKIKKFNFEKPFPYKNNKFDIIIANQVIEHLVLKSHFINECRRILNPEGMLILATENISSLDNIFSIILGQEPFSQHTSELFHTNTFLSPHFMMSYQDKKIKNKILKREFKKVFGTRKHFGHKNVLSYFGLKRILEVAKFKNIKIKGFGHLLFLTSIFPYHSKIINSYSIK